MQLSGAVFAVAVVAGITGCGALPQSGPADRPVADAVYIGAETCMTCHANLQSDHRLTGHAHALTALRGQPPVFDDRAARAGVPEPPPGFGWSDLALVIGGYTKGANFVDRDGRVLIDSATGQPVQYRLEHAPSATSAGFAAFDPDAVTTQPYGADCFQCHTTGPRSLEESGQRRYQNRPGIGGTFAQAGVQCEACHGPGSRHIPAPGPGELTVDGSAAACGRCHASAGLDTLAVAGGFLLGNQQAAEMLATKHVLLQCTSCHDPHVSVAYDRDRAIRNHCTDCHRDRDLAGHQGKIFVRGDYVETLACESCHMPFATRTLFSAGADVVGDQGGRLGDGRSHLVKIDTTGDRFESRQSADGARLQPGPEGMALTLDVVCLRCHNAKGSAFALSVTAAAQIAPGLHGSP